MFEYSLLSQFYRSQNLFEMMTTLQRQNSTELTGLGNIANVNRSSDSNERPKVIDHVVNNLIIDINLIVYNIT